MGGGCGENCVQELWRAVRGSCGGKTCGGTVCIGGSVCGSSVRKTVLKKLCVGAV